jgi:hypothetical protein
MKILLALLALWSISFSPALAQECQPDLTDAIDQLTQAQTAFNEGDTETGLTHLSEARQVLALEEVACINYAPETAGDKRSNPVPFGQRKSFEFNGEAIAIEIIDYSDNANEASETEPPDGQRYVVATVNFYCEGSSDDQCTPSLSYFSGVGSNNVQFGVALDYTRFSYYPPALFGGGQTQFEVPFLVDEDETDIVLIMEYFMSGQFYFATE